MALQRTAAGKQFLQLQWDRVSYLGKCLWVLAGHATTTLTWVFGSNADSMWLM